MTIYVHFVLLDGCLMLDWAGPAEVLRFANLAMRERGLPDAFVWHFVGPQPECHTSIGATVSHIAPLPQLHPTAGRADWVVLLGQVSARMNLETASARAVLHFERRRRRSVGA